MGGIVIDYPLYEARRQISMTVNDAMKRRLANMALLITGMIWGSGFVVMKIRWTACRRTIYLQYGSP